MGITIHLLLLGAVVIFTAACLLTRGGRAERPVWKALVAALPPWLLGSTCMFLLSVRGVPTVEWIIPTVSMLLIGLWCRSDHLFKLARWAMPLFALALCVNFGFLVSEGYTASTRSDALAVTRQATLRAAADELRGRYPGDEELPAGPVSELLPGTAVGEVTVEKLVREWHTPLTRLYRIERKPAAVWYPGGKVGEAADQLELRPL